MLPGQRGGWDLEALAIQESGQEHSPYVTLVWFSMDKEGRKGVPRVDGVLRPCVVA